MSVLNREDLMKMDWKAIASALKDPATQGRVMTLMKGDRDLNAHINQLLLARNAELQQVEEQVDHQLVISNPPSTEALAAEAQQMATETPATTQPAAEVPAPVPVPERKRIVREYQVRDEDGNPIGRPTHLEAWSAEEMIEKMQTAHENATRAFHRLKKQKLQFTEKEQNRLLTPDEIHQAAAKALEAKDASEAERLVRGMIEAEFKQKELELQQQRDFQEGVKIGNEFVMRHLYDFNPCRANMIALGEYLKEHGLDFTLDNLEAALLDLTEQGDKLALPVQRASEAKRPAEQATNTPATTVASAAVAQPELPAAPAAATTQEAVAQPTVETTASQPAVAATVTTPVATQHNAATPTRRPGVNGSLPPGSMSANRPTAVDPAQARREFMRELKEMKPDVMKNKLKTDPQFVKQLATYGVRIQ
jgi:hypothetical protein